MSYDLRIGVKIEGFDDYAVIAVPEYCSPTYNLREMFVNCMGWEYKQGIWYQVSEVLPYIEQGIYELTFKKKKYEKYNPDNGWGSIESALKALQSLLECIKDQAGLTGWSDNEIPIEHLYMCW